MLARATECGGTFQTLPGQLRGTRVQVEIPIGRVETASAREKQ
jgi:signal transduction histidine kinase